MKSQCCVPICSLSVQSLRSTAAHACLCALGQSVGLQGTKELVLDEQVRRMSRMRTSVEFHGGVLRVAVGLELLERRRG